MNKIEFSYNNAVFLVQCNNDDKMKDVIEKFLTKSGQNKKNVFFYITVKLLMRN